MSNSYLKPLITGAVAVAGVLLLEEERRFAESLEY